MCGTSLELSFMLVSVEAESKSTERHAVRNRSQLLISWVKKQKVRSHNLW